MGSHRHQEAVQTRGGQEVVGLHQGEETAGPREQAVLQARQKDGAHLRQGEDQSLRHGQVPQDPPDFIDDDATPGIISILSPPSLSLSLYLCHFVSQSQDEPVVCRSIVRVNDRILLHHVVRRSYDQYFEFIIVKKTTEEQEEGSEAWEASPPPHLSIQLIHVYLIYSFS